MQGMIDVFKGIKQNKCILWIIFNLGNLVLIHAILYDQRM